MVGDVADHERGVSQRRVEPLKLPAAPSVLGPRRATVRTVPGINALDDVALATGGLGAPHGPHSSRHDRVLWPPAKARTAADVLI
jgi:hypothetical protein